jgi:outer membrane immunogenic protein
MQQQTRLVLALVATLIGTAAWADGVPTRLADPCCNSRPFAGGYIGAAVGYAQQSVDVLNTAVGAPAFGLTFKDKDASATFGAYVGYNWQRCCDPLVFGVEADFNFLNTSPTAFDIEVFPAGTETTALDSSIDWFGTLRARLGYMIHDHMLLYATGGLAYARADHKFTDNCPACVAGLTDQGTLAQTDSVTKAGWTMGGGGELLHDDRWILRAEALYVDLGSETHDYNFVLPNGGTSSGSAKWDDQFWFARIGLAYRFDHP